VISALRRFWDEPLTEHIVQLVLLPFKVGWLYNWIEEGGRGQGYCFIFISRKRGKVNDFLMGMRHNIDLFAQNWTWLKYAMTAAGGEIRIHL